MLFTNIQIAHRAVKRTRASPAGAQSSGCCTQHASREHHHVALPHRIASPQPRRCSLIAATASAADKVTFLTSWYAQAEHGGFYQAKAAGLYEKAGLDVTIKMGGPQVNGLQLLLAGEADVMMGYDFQVLNSISKGMPVITIATSFQKDLQGIMAHDHVKGLDDLKDKTILVATPGRSIVVAVAASASTATPTRRRRPIRSTCSRSSTTRTSCSNPIRRRSRSRRCRRACRSSSS